MTQTMIFFSSLRSVLTTRHCEGAKVLSNREFINRKAVSVCQEHTVHKLEIWGKEIQ